MRQSSSGTVTAHPYSDHQPSGHRPFIAVLGECVLRSEPLVSKQGPARVNRNILPLEIRGDESLLGCAIDQQPPRSRPRTVVTLGPLRVGLVDDHLLVRVIDVVEILGR